MSVIKSKGTSLSLTIATVSTKIAQIVSVETSGVENETTEADSLDNTDPKIPYIPTGRTEPGKVTGELFVDSALQSGLLGYLDTPPTALIAGTLNFNGAVSIPLKVAGVGE